LLARAASGCTSPPANSMVEASRGWAIQFAVTKFLATGSQVP
jgi:hypothetical protein